MGSGGTGLIPVDLPLMPVSFISGASHNTRDAHSSSWYGHARSTGSGDAVWHAAREPAAGARRATASRGKSVARHHRSYYYLVGIRYRRTDPPTHRVTSILHSTRVESGCFLARGKDAEQSRPSKPSPTWSMFGFDFCLNFLVIAYCTCWFAVDDLETMRDTFLGT